MITLLRLGHRPERDKRLTTHCALVARAFGADQMVYSGIRDPALEASIRKVVKKWGGGFQIKHERNWKQLIKEWNGQKIHLTMYGMGVDDIKNKIKPKNLLIIVGGQKVPSEVLEMVDLNVSVGNQPHSEAAAIAIILDRVFNGQQFKRQFGGLIIVPLERGKKVVKTCK